MPLKIRHLKNKKRGTEVTYATIPLEEAKNISRDEIKNYVSTLIGKESPYHHTGFVRDLQLFANSPRKEEVLNYATEDSVGYYKLIKTKDKIVVMPQCYSLYRRFWE